MNRNINFDFADISGKVFKFSGDRELVEFLKSEASFWSDQREIIGNQRQSHNTLSFCSNFKQASKAIDGWNDQKDNIDDASFQQQINGLRQSNFRHVNTHWLWSGHAYTPIFVQCHKDHGLQVASAFLEYATKKQVGNLNSSEIFLGVMIGYEFVHQDSELLKRRNGEKISLGQLRNQLETQTNELVGEVEAFKGSFSAWNTETRKNWDKWIHDSDGGHTEQQSKHKDDFIEFMDGCRTRIEDLENTYQEKLRLEKPANYWNKAARKYGIQGGLWALALLASVLLGIVYFSGFFEYWLKGQEILVKLNTIQGVVIFGTILATYAFLVRVLSRLAFSSFHLMRDAEEREQLTYLYLSLVNEKSIGDTDRTIVLQALFSRSETGLLASEHGPSMPGVGEIIKATTKSK